jgi:hypothetical protein
MNQAIADLWAMIGSEAYWSSFIGQHQSDFVSFEDRWPQPGFVGSE